MTLRPLDEPRLSAAGRSLQQELRRPRSLLLLLAALMVAVGFAALAQWQLGRAVQNGVVQSGGSTEVVRALSSVATPQQAQSSSSVGQQVSTSGRWVTGDWIMIGDRLNDGARGWWVTGHFITAEPAGAQLAVAVGWTSSVQRARAATAALNRETAFGVVAIRGRYVDSDAADDSVGLALDAVSIPVLVNRWHTDIGGPTYNGYVTSRDALAGLTPIDSPKPVSDVELNFLNVFYAVEWVLFALGGFYLWFRLVRDRWELDSARGAPDAAA